MHGLMDFVFPYLVQFLKQYSTSVDTLMAERKEVRPPRHRSGHRWDRLHLGGFMFGCAVRRSWSACVSLKRAHSTRMLASNGITAFVFTVCSEGELSVISPLKLPQMLAARKKEDDTSAANAAQNNAHLGLAPLMLTQGPAGGGAPPLATALSCLVMLSDQPQMWCMASAAVMQARLMQQW